MDALKLASIFLLCISQCSSQEGSENFACMINGIEKGAKGDIGPPGPPGKCITESENNKDNDKGDAASRPLKTTCKNANIIGQKPLWMGKNEIESFKIKCEETEHLTCVAQDVIANNIVTTIEVKENTINEKQKLWWNTMAVKPLVEMYELRPTQILWLQGLANSARQTLRIYGLDFKATDSDITESLVQLLAWNDILIDHKSIPNLFHYDLIIPQDCIDKNSTTEPCQYVDFTVKTDKSTRIPITDIVFSLDLSKKTYKIGVQIVELCFN